MPKAICLIFADQTTKKVIWKHQYGCLSTLKAFVAALRASAPAETHLMGKTSTSFLLLTDQNVYNKWLTDNYQDHAVTIKVFGFKMPDRQPPASPTLGASSLKPTKEPMKFKSYGKQQQPAMSSSYKRLKISNFLEFSEKNFSSYHVIYKMEGYLIASGFQRLKEGQQWTLKAGEKYYIKRGFYSSLIAFIVPTNFDVSKAYFKLLGTHADSPCLRLTPKSKIKSEGFWQLSVQTYGGALWRTWFDRELGIGGRVTVRDPEDDSKLDVRIYTSNSALAFVPSLCPHLQKVPDENELNLEVHLKPIIGSILEDNVPKSSSANKGDPQPPSDNYKFLLEDIANQFQVPVNSIVDFDLCLADWTKAISFGPADDFIAASKMDNTLSVWAALDAITRIAEDSQGLANHGIPLIIAFDHEEVGSGSFTGADSDFVETTLSRIISSFNKGDSTTSDLYKSCLANSFLVSADMGHSFNPNYPEYYKQNFKPVLNQGVLIKTNDSQRYTTSSISRPILKRLADKRQIEVQDFVVRNDKPCGSTIGPFMSKKIGVLSIDVGAPLLAMHSIREFAGSNDLVGYSDLFYYFLLEQLPTISDSFE